MTRFDPSFIIFGATFLQLCVWVSHTDAFPVNATSLVETRNEKQLIPSGSFIELPVGEKVIASAPKFESSSEPATVITGVIPVVEIRNDANKQPQPESIKLLVQQNEAPAEQLLLPAAPQLLPSEGVRNDGDKSNQDITKILTVQSKAPEQQNYALSAPISSNYAPSFPGPAPLGGNDNEDDESEDPKQSADQNRQKNIIKLVNQLTDFADERRKNHLEAAAEWDAADHDGDDNDYEDVEAYEEYKYNKKQKRRKNFIKLVNVLADFAQGNPQNDEESSEDSDETADQDLSEQQDEEEEGDGTGDGEEFDWLERRKDRRKAIVKIVNGFTQGASKPESKAKAALLHDGVVGRGQTV